MRRTDDATFFTCPICGKKPYVKTYEMNAGYAVCKGHGFHRHKRILVIASFVQPSKLLKTLAEKWNQKQYEQVRFLFYPNGNPFKGDSDENA